MTFKKTRWVAILAVVALVIAACGDAADDTAAEEETSTTAAPTTTTTAAPTTTTEPPPPIELLVWADEKRAPVVEEVAAAFSDETGVIVNVELVDFGQIRDQVQVAGPAGEGPDVFVGAHDWTGELAANGVVTPIDLVNAGDFFDVGLTAFSYEGSLYAVPAATEAIAMYYNTDLVPEAPSTFEELADVCAGLEGIDNCVGIPGGGDGGDAYHMYPFVSALGGFIFEYSDESGFNTANVGLDSEETLAGITFLETQVANGVVGSVNYGDAKTLFTEGRQPFWITGPWELGDAENWTVNWDVAKIPTIEGNAPGPFVGVQGFFLSAFSENALVAQSFLLDFIATSNTQQALYDADPRLPAHKTVAEGLDEIAATFALSAADGVPMPNIPEMGAVWGPLGDNILLLRNGELSAADAMDAAAEAVRAALEG